MLGDGLRKIIIIITVILFLTLLSYELYLVIFKKTGIISVNIRKFSKNKKKHKKKHKKERRTIENDLSEDSEDEKREDDNIYSEFEDTHKRIEEKPMYLNEFHPISFDIGGSLAKVAFVWSGKELPTVIKRLTKTHPKVYKYDQTFVLGIANKNRKRGENISKKNKKKSKTPKQKLAFLEFPQEKLGEFLEAISKHDSRNSFFFEEDCDVIFGTGGGALKNSILFEKALGVEFVAKNEMECLVRGLNYILKGNKLTRSSVFTYTDYSGENDSGKISTEKNWIEPEDLKNEEIFPYVFAQIGSGVSIIRVDGKNSYKRITGTAIGGATFVGLSKIFLNDYEKGKEEKFDFDSLLKMCEGGDNRNIDLLVGDIYGNECGKFDGLHPDIVASFFGKVATGRAGKGDFSKKDLIRSLIYLLGVNTAQITCMVAKIHNINRLVFSGGFMRKNQRVWHYLNVAVKYYSMSFGMNTVPKVYFVKHNKFLGCIGSILKEPFIRRKSVNDISEIFNPENLDDDEVLKKMFKLACIYAQKGYAQIQFRDRNEISIESRLNYYALYKQATLGDAPKRKPTMNLFDPVEQIKWQSWNYLRGMEKKEAMKTYLEVINKQAPNWSSFEGLQKYKERIFGEEVTQE